MGRSLLPSTVIPVRFPQIPKSIPPFNRSIHPIPPTFAPNYQRIRGFSIPTKTFCTKAVLSESPNPKRYPKMGSDSVGPIPPSQLIQVVEHAANTGAQVWHIPRSPCLVAEKTKEKKYFIILVSFQVVMEAVNKPRNVAYKGLTDLVTEWGNFQCSLTCMISNSKNDSLIIDLARHVFQ